MISEPAISEAISAEFLFLTFDFGATTVSCNNTTVLIVCESESEKAYIQQLNRLLSRGEYGGAAFCPYPVGNGHFKPVRKEYKRVQSSQRNCTLIIWVDRDIYIRNENDCETNRLATKDMCFYFSIMNFEDFLMLHQDAAAAQKWFSAIAAKKHWANPLTDDQYLPEFLKFFPDYKKKGVAIRFNEREPNKSVSKY